ncbi:DNA replication/repair protein RecF [Arenivirga flava]|uniref:DNA replication and repair protein RecF n=1 Tax=Arenivirga flava TaxID=1930060 RepID=A0AA37XC07_9MICO|nr:DNA replication/repair protein RecF [Arenivirga flava]GMA29040.1 DNA replication and repair protein RecF [Arenivirga flava]
MILSHLSLLDFRNYRTAEVGFAAGSNVVVGRNGQGKTNLVEAVGYLATLGSHRVSSDQALVRHGADAAIVRARLEHEGREVTAELQLNRVGANRAQLNRSPVRPREIARYLTTVLFAPEDLAIVRGEPGGRRRFLDELLIQRTPRLAGVITDYERVLRQRNTLLKTARSSGAVERSLSTLEVWDERMIALGTEIVLARHRLVRALEPELVAAYEGIAGAGQPVRLGESLSVLGADPDADAAASPFAEEPNPAEVREAYGRAIAERRRAELDRGVSLVGPHRDDLVLELNELPARSTASHGESWSYALALRLAAAEVLRRESNGGDPIVILDDVFAELDERRRRRLATAIEGYEQVLITAAVEGDVPESLLGHRVRIEAGAVLDEASEGVEESS